MKWNDERGESLLEVLAGAALAVLVSLMVIRFIDMAVKVEGRQREQTAVMAEGRNVKEILIRTIQSSGYVEIEENSEATSLYTEQEVFHYDKEEGILSWRDGAELVSGIHDLTFAEENGVIWLELLFEHSKGQYYTIRGAAYPRNGRKGASLLLE